MGEIGSKASTFGFVRLVQGKEKMVLYALLSWALIIGAYAVWVARGLRPIADDYTHGAMLSQGPIIAMQNWWDTWAGDMSTILVNVLIVGWPLQNLPWAFVSSIAFVASGSMVAGALYLIIFQSRSDNQEIRITRFYYVFPLLLVSWWSYWWLNELFSPNDPYFESLSSAITFWQNVNATYVFIPAINIFLWFVLENARRKRGGSNRLVPFYVLFGIFIGMSGAVFAASVVILLSLMVIGFWLNGQKINARGLLSWTVLCFFAVFSACASYLSPGSQRRSAVLPEVSLNGETFVLLLQSVIPSLSDWWKALVNPGMLISTLGILVFATLLIQNGVSFDNNRLRQVAVGLIGFSLVIAIVNGLSEIFSYSAFWHRIQSPVVLWLGVLALTVSFSGRSILRRINLSGLVMVGLIVVVTSTAAIAQMTLEIQYRKVLWESGPAPAWNIGDIEDESGFQRAAWLELVKQREAPDRGLEP